MAGVRRLGAALGELAATWQLREAIRVVLPDRFRVDYIDGGLKRRTVTSEATDGSQRWRVSPGQIAVGPARPLPEPLARLADPSWLLDWRLTGGAEVTEGGRRGIRIRIGERWPVSQAPPRTVPVDAVIDAELGILLRLSQEQDGRPARQQVLTKVAVLEHPDTAGFRIQIPAGTRVIHDSGGLADELNIPAPVQAAVHVAGKAIGTAARVGGFLDSMRRQAKDKRDPR
jgi:hypothetical protein